MEEERGFLQRYGGHLILVVVAVLVFLAARTLSFSQFFGPEAQSGDESSEFQASGETSAPRSSEERLAAGGSPVDMQGVPILVNYSLSPALNPHTFEGQKPEHHFITYTVQANDTPIGIAEKFGIKPETLLGGNPFLSEESSALQTGTVLTILPIDGVLHDVAEGESLERLSEFYGVPMEDIIAYEPNKLSFPYRLYPGTQILVPGAVREVFVWSAPSLPPRSSTSDSTGSGIAPLIQGTGTFIWPVSGRRITQYYWYGHQAIDVAAGEGSTVVAADTGTVTWAGWNVYGYGNLVVINHGNGYETYYAHLSGINVYPGQVVYQGNVIGATGNTGRSSGPHIHIEIRYYNTQLEPLSYLR